MQLSNDDLSQLDETELLNLSEAELRRISIKLLTDLKEARERLNQNSHNSSRPPSSEAPWEKETQQDVSSNHSEETNKSDNKKLPPTEKPDKEAKQSSKKETEESRKPGKQLGAKGFGRTQKLAITHYQDHVPETCGCCQQPLNATIKKATTAFETIDLEWADEKAPGLRLTNTKHTYYEISCHCGHVTLKEPHRTNSQDTLQDITCSQWRLVGSGLSRERVQEFLNDWLGLKLSIGTINNTLHESGAAALPIQDELVKEIVASQQLHVDETSWMELTTFLWLWVFSTESVTAYWIATRSSELIENILGQTYCGWLMSDGYQVYRRYLNRVRCWAHLIRKANGLQESLDRDSQLFGKKTLDLMNILMTAIGLSATV
jgi:hypothetical protein